MHELPFNRGARLACAIVMWGTLMACQPTAPAAPAPGASAATDQPTGAQKNDRSEQAHLFKLNPSPRRVFEVTFEIHDAPGPLMAVRGSAGYSAPQVPNCTFVTNAWAGTWGTPFKGLSLPVTPAGPNRFVMTVALDAMLDEDYYGKGVCRWEMGGAGAGFAASASEEDTRYGLSLDAKEFVDGATYRQHYWKGDYPKLETRDSAVSVSNPGRRDPDGYKEPFRSNLFSITAQVKAKP
ncbi:hypothetical protein [Hydrogenophaga pseudoflava]|uniref:hypothetical protein n=1 Tax=Hydrogenophaga pseudoflava TaxID=47421 RepID=UPI000B227FE3|nr:hypothetical protein [Hydrogenophaga pseudoflava]